MIIPGLMAITMDHYIPRMIEINRQSTRTYISRNQKHHLAMAQVSKSKSDMFVHTYMQPQLQGLYQLFNISM